MLYVFFGQDDFSIHQAVEEVKQGLGDREALSTNTTILDGHGLKLHELMAILSTMPFLGERRLVIVEGLLGRFQDGVDDAWRGVRAELAEMPPTAVLVLVDGGIRRNNPLLRELSGMAVVREFPPLRGANLVRWIEGRVRDGGGGVSAMAARLLADLVGENLWVMAGEIEKLLLYSSGKRIEEEDVRAVVGYAAEANVFEMVDAVLEGRASVAGGMVHRLLDEGAAAPYLLFMITRQMRLVIQARELLSGETPAREIKDRLGLTSDYALRKTIAQAKASPPRRLEQAYRKLLETDLLIKTGRRGEELALDILIAELCRI